MIKEMKVEDTSVIAWLSLLANGKFATKEAVVIDALLKFQPLTARMMEERTGLERNSLTVSAHTLETKRCKIKKVFKQPCAVTGHLATYYMLNDKGIIEDGGANA
jgi:hypothetical protein